MLYQRLVDVLESDALDSLKRAFGRWIYKSFIRKKRPGIQLPEIDDFHEVHAMLQQRVEQWNEELRERGREEGRQEGREETRRQVAMALIQRTGLDDTTVAESTGLSVAEVEVLRDRLRH